MWDHKVGDRVRWKKNGLVGHVLSQNASQAFGKRPRFGYRVGFTVVMGDDPTGLGLNRQTWEMDIPSRQVEAAPS